MKKILVPTDFSSNAKSAAQYGAWIAQKVSGSLELVHVIEIGSSQSTLHNWRKLNEQMVATAKAGADRLMGELRNPVVITYNHLTGFPLNEVVENHAIETKADLIVIGSRGGSEFKKALFGSNAATLIDSSSTPVLIVPSDAKYDGIKKILYATDMVHLDEEIKTIARFAKPFDAEVIILHVTKDDSKKRDRSSLEQILRRMADFQKIRFMVVEEEDIATGIEKLIEIETPDVLAMFTHQLGPFEKLFGKGITRTLAFQNTLPLLAINRTKSR